MHGAGKLRGRFESAPDNCLVDYDPGGDVRQCAFCQASPCVRIGSKLRCSRSQLSEMLSMNENDFECFASTGVNTPGTMSPNFGLL
jgi:hypothetical protein